MLKLPMFGCRVDKDWPPCGGWWLSSNTTAGRPVNDSSQAEIIERNLTDWCYCWEPCAERVCDPVRSGCCNWLVMSAVGVGKGVCLCASYLLALLRSLWLSVETLCNFCPRRWIMHNDTQLFFFFEIQRRKHKAVCVMQTCCKFEGLFKEKWTHHLWLTVQNGNTDLLFFFSQRFNKNWHDSRSPDFTALLAGIHGDISAGDSTYSTFLEPWSPRCCFRPRRRSLSVFQSGSPPRTGPAARPMCC